MLAGGAQEEGLLGGAKVGLLHGRLSGDEKAAALAAFASGETPVLIATTVVEARRLRCQSGPAHTLVLSYGIIDTL